jgi:hypothetical protein
MQSSRRGFLALGSAGIAASMVDDAIAQPSAPSRSQVNLVSPKLFAGVRNFREAKIKLTTELGNTELADWLRVFNKSVDEHSIEAVKRGGNAVLTAYRFVYEPQHIEDLLRSASALLDQALAYRNDLAALEISGVNAALQYLVTTNGIHIQNAVAETASQPEKANAVIKYEGNAAKKHDDPGDQYHAMGLAESAKISAAQDAEILALFKQQTALLLDAQQMVLKQLTAPGGGQNYSQRYMRILKYYTEDLAEAYQKCLCVASALPGVYGLTDLGLPHFTLNNTDAQVADWVVDRLKKSPYNMGTGTALDALVDWCRATIRTIEKIQQEEVEFTVSIPAVQGWVAGASPAARTSLIGAAALKEAMKELGTGVITYPLKPEHFSEEPLRNMRVIGVGLNVIGADRNYVYSATITGPKQQNTLAPQGYMRPPTMLGRVRPTITPDNAAADPALIFSETCHNLNPVGDWRVKINPRATKVDNLTPLSPVRSDAQITEVFLHLRIRATYSA